MKSYKPRFKIKKQGYILFHYVDYPEYKNEKQTFKLCCDEDGEVCGTIKELKDKYLNHWDEKWDYPKRHMIHYFYLDLKTMKYHSLPRWKYAFKPEWRDNQSDEFSATVDSKYPKDT
jgi:hypothetical protein